MKMFAAVVSCSAVLATFAYAETSKPGNMMNQKMMHQEQVQNQNQNQIQTHNQMMEKMQERERMMNAPDKTSQGMGSQNKGNAYGQGQGMMQGNVPEKVSQEMGKKGKGNAYGEGQGMMQGQGKKMGGGKGGR